MTTKRYWLDGVGPRLEFYTIWGVIEEALVRVKGEPASVQFIRLTADDRLVGCVSNREGGVVIDVDEVQFD
jgi:hypothetical protein